MSKEPQKSTISSHLFQPLPSGREQNFWIKISKIPLEKSQIWSVSVPAISKKDKFIQFDCQLILIMFHVFAANRLASEGGMPRQRPEKPALAGVLGPLWTPAALTLWARRFRIIRLDYHWLATLSEGAAHAANSPAAILALGEVKRMRRIFPERK